MRIVRLGATLPLLLGIAAAAFAADWSVPGDFASIQQAIDNPAVLAGDTILVGPGDHAGAIVSKPVTIKGTGGATIATGPLHSPGRTMGFRVIAGADGTTISHLRFTVTFPVFPPSTPLSQFVDNVTVTQCTLVNPLQGITCWKGRGWEISHNKIEGLRTDNGGGIGILIGDYSARAGGIFDNVVSHNTITGALTVPATDGGGYNGTGIVIYADYRWGRSGAAAIEYNRIVKNKISLTLNNLQPTPNVDVVALELTDTRNNSALNVIHDNAIGFNDFRGTLAQLALTPADLDDLNDVSRNLGDNRGHGLHPSAFAD
jgi:hypothetical protein